jgi:GntR family transcriptional regulator
MEAHQLFVDERSPLPVYAQLSEQVLGAVARGTARAGERLPSVRDVAATLGVNANTVNHAYAELERIGVVETRRGRGTFVAARRRAPADRASLKELAEPFVARAQALGYPGQHIVKTVAAIVRKTK